MVPVLLKTSHRHHTMLVEAIRNRDPNAAKEHMESHIDSLIEYWPVVSKQPKDDC